MAATNKVKVLICDDSLLVRKKLRDILAEMDCEVIEASDGKMVVDVYKYNKPDLVFLDIVMPEADGLTALQRLREQDPEAKVIMLSSAGTSSKLIEALKGGAMDFIQKPYSVEQIAKAIAKISK
ncbi:MULTISPECIES: response regulator [Propionispora]|jgi:two-component system chemotaxis response regulator CheY|uniref:Two-component system, chemotaxis family, response regulator CheY n=2 Tax=Propionispora TaxID=112902 RepID=A0A1H8VCX6_9FIRM|nr:MULTISPECIES: response regulator [Propionispora]SEP13191.1 two-component system, chemotaxis family, response regulator CheY [Propionispora vibrioides]SHJ81112.1 two-component system, chemotaxis family, response regulator CheY [Propionispora hippei DSM 15287]